MSATWAIPSGSGDGWPEIYERGRPGWPTDAVHVAGVPTTARVLDLGAGTGKLTRILAAEFERVVAVEPSEPMRRLLGRYCPGVQLHAGTGHEIPLADASVDAVYAAQAFHWFADADALAEIARVLRPRGALVLLWNRPGGPWEPSTEPAELVLLERMPSDVDHIPLDLGGPEARSGWQPSVTDSPFRDFEAKVLANPQTLDREGLIAFYASMGWLADLPDSERLPLLDKVRSRLNAPEYSRQWETHTHWARLTTRTQIAALVWASVRGCPPSGRRLKAAVLATRQLIQTCSTTLKGRGIGIVGLETLRTARLHGRAQLPRRDAAGAGRRAKRRIV